MTDRQRTSGLSGAAISPLSGELVDPELEADYLEAVLPEARSRLRVSWWIVTLTALAYVGKDALSMGPESLAIATLGRVTGVLPGLILLVWSQARSGRDLHRRALLSCAAFLPHFVGVNWLYDQATMMSALWFSLLMLMNGLWAAHSFRNLLLSNTIILLSGIFVFVSLGPANHQQQVGVIIMLFTAFAWAVIAPAMLGAARRREYSTLLSAFPPSVVRRLVTGEPVAEHHDAVTVLFADLVGFTRLSERLSPQELLPILEELFTLFDALAAENGVQPIKTIGDSYMAAAGVPEPRPDHVEAAARMALEMRRRVAEGRFGGHALQVRIGVHTGPLVAGVVRARRQLYDLWGDTVNVASRLESHGVPGEIQVSEAVREALAPLGYRLEPRGELALKGHASVQAALLLAGPDEASERPS